MLFRVFLTLLIVSVLAAFVYFLRWSMLTPVVLSKNQSLVLVVKVTEHAPELSVTLESLEWMRSSGFLPMNIVIADCGMDRDTREIAMRLQRDKSGVSVCELSDVAESIIAG